MTRLRVGPEFWPWPLLIAAWGGAFVIACRLAAGERPAGGAAGSLAAQAGGAGRAALAGQFFDQADRAFHRGAGRYRPPSFTGAFERLGREITPRGHQHLEEDEVNEIVPWLRLATRADPHHVEGYVLAAFWLAGEGGRPDLAERVLQEARRANPGDYRVALERGRLAVRTARWAEAERAFDAGLRLWNRQAHADGIQARLDKAEMLTYRGLLAEQRGEREPAWACYRDVLALFPGRGGIRARADALARGERPDPAPAALWRVLIAQRQHVCDRESEGAEHDHEHSPREGAGHRGPPAKPST